MTKLVSLVDQRFKGIRSARSSWTNVEVGQNKEKNW